MNEVLQSGDLLVFDAAGFGGVDRSGVAGVSSSTGRTTFQSLDTRKQDAFVPVGSSLYFSASLAGGGFGLYEIRDGQLTRIAQDAGPPRLLLACPDRSYYLLADRGIVDVRPGAAPAVVATGTLVPTVGISPDGRFVIFGRPGAGAAGGARYYLLDTASGQETSFSDGPAGGEVVALAGTAAPPTTQRPFVRGDANQDATLDISDAVVTLLYLFGGGGPLPCLDAADVDDDGAVSVSDAIRLLESLFAAAAIPSPFPAAGLDPTPDALGCAAL